MIEIQDARRAANILRVFKAFFAAQRAAIFLRNFQEIREISFIEKKSKLSYEGKFRTRLPDRHSGREIWLKKKTIPTAGQNKQKHFKTVDFRLARKTKTLTGLMIMST